MHKFTKIGKYRGAKKENHVEERGSRPSSPRAIARPIGFSHESMKVSLHTISSVISLIKKYIIIIYYIVIIIYGFLCMVYFFLYLHKKFE